MNEQTETEKKEATKSNECGGIHQTATSTNTNSTALAVTQLIIKEVNEIRAAPL
jgi:hypothetical protein